MAVGIMTANARTNTTPTVIDIFLCSMTNLTGLELTNFCQILFVILSVISHPIAICLVSDSVNVCGTACVVSDFFATDDTSV